MKRCMVALIVLGMTGISQASTTITAGNLKTTESLAKIATPSAQAFVRPMPRIPRFKVVRSNPHKVSNRILNDDTDDFIDDDGLITSYRRRDLQKIVNDPDQLSDHIMSRLATARQAALAKYREVWVSQES